MKLNQPYYIEPRKTSTHIDLNGKWDFCWCDRAYEDIGDLCFEHSATLPSSVYWCLNEAGVLPHPYHNENSKLYSWVDEKVWYFKKNFIIDSAAKHKTAFLCFDGISYYCRVWLNRQLLGEHEGMFGGPVCNVGEYLSVGENEIIVEVTACNFGKKQTFDSWNLKGDNREIVPWNIMRDYNSCKGNFIVMGIWNRVRIELLEPIHLSRPYMFTESIEQDKATISFEAELANGSVNELKPFVEYTSDCYSYTCAYDNGITGKKLDETVCIGIKITEPDTKRVVYNSIDTEQLLDYDGMLVDERYYELQFLKKKITIKNPRLWYPSGIGEPYLYDVEITLSKSGELLDTHTLKFGIRTFTSDYTAGDKYRVRWEKFLFSVNGKQIFIKGINWLPLDYLYKTQLKEYRWLLEAVKNAGVQFIRVWSGGGMPETDEFYNICDELGIMVWQDHMLANTTNTQNYPQDILEAQESYNLYRIRNHPSLVMHCGGNEFNPYSFNNAASMFVISRIIKDLDPSRIFHYTTRDKGSAHIYRDMEPNWFRHIYKHLPFLAESGIHSFPNFKTFCRVVDKKETQDILPDLTKPEFYEHYTQLIHHFAEYQPDRVPRMLSRISQISDITNLTLEQMCEASMVQAYEYYQLLIGAMRENYPYCGGVIPWALKRPWPVVGVQMVDGLGLPTYPYYAMQNGYRPISVCFLEQWSIVAPNESVPLKVRIFNDSGTSVLGGKLVLSVYTPSLKIAAEHECSVDDENREYNFGDFTLPDDFTDKCFIISVDLVKDGLLVHRDTHFIKCTSIFSDNRFFAEYRNSVHENLTFKNGPWLKDDISSAGEAQITVDALRAGKYKEYDVIKLNLKNTSEYPAYPVTVEIINTECRHFADDNFFLLKPQESRMLTLTCDGLKPNETARVLVKYWNGKNIEIEL